MRLVALFGVVAAMAIAACGGGVSDDSGPTPVADDASPAMERDSAARAGDPGAARNAKPESPAERGTAIAVGESEFGRMLFGADGQAIYIFENDGHEQTVCYGDCAEDWPPVLTEGEPQGEKGVDDSLLATVKRRDGTLQVTYDGQPLYFYAHEDPGEVRCHNVNLNGGFWWAVAPDGERLP